MDVKPDVPFKILVANFGESPHDLVPNQHIATTEEHPTSLIESHISHGEMLGLVTDAPSNDDGKFRKWVFNPRDTDVINRHFQMKSKSIWKMTRSQSPRMKSSWKSPRTSKKMFEICCARMYGYEPGS